jgi:anti-sigma B factor antagonist
MEIKVRTPGDVIIVDLEGQLDTGTSLSAETEINKVLGTGCSKLVINLANTDYVSSSGLRIFLITAKKMAAQSGKLKLCGPNDVVREILEISGFTTILDVCATEEEALSQLLS